VGDDFIQLRATENDCVYLFDLATGKCKKLCDIGSPADFPADVKEKINALQRETAKRG
jgi:hypothetical protein